MKIEKLKYLNRLKIRIFFFIVSLTLFQLSCTIVNNNKCDKVLDISWNCSIIEKRQILRIIIDVYSILIPEEYISCQEYSFGNYNLYNDCKKIKNDFRWSTLIKKWYENEKYVVYSVSINYDEFCQGCYIYNQSPTTSFHDLFIFSKYDNEIIASTYGIFDVRHFIDLIEKSKIKPDKNLDMYLKNQKNERKIRYKRIIDVFQKSNINISAEVIFNKLNSVEVDLRYKDWL